MSEQKRKYMMRVKLDMHSGMATKENLWQCPVLYGKKQYENYQITVHSVVWLHDTICEAAVTDEPGKETMYPLESHMYR